MRTVLFLRRINVGGSHLKMATLLETIAGAGYPDSVSVVASGNVIIDSPNPIDTDRIVSAISEAHGFVTQVFDRSEADVRRIPVMNPFAGRDGKVEVVFLEGIPSKGTVRELAGIATGPDELTIVGQEIFWLRPIVNGTLSEPHPKETVLRRVLGADSTRRTLGTVERIVKRMNRLDP